MGALPELTATGGFYLLYTDVKRYDGNFKDTHNYLTTCETIDGVWSDPVHLNSSGFDPSLFHDDDGRKWYLNMVWDHRSGHNRFAGIALQEHSPSAASVLSVSAESSSPAPNSVARRGRISTSEAATTI